MCMPVASLPLVIYVPYRCHGDEWEELPVAHTAVQGTWSSDDRDRLKRMECARNEAAGISTTEKRRTVMETT